MLVRALGQLRQLIQIGVAGSYEVIVDISPLSLEQQKVVRLGMSARLNVITYSAKNSMVVPASAITRWSRRKCCFLSILPHGEKSRFSSDHWANSTKWRGSCRIASRLRHVIFRVLASCLKLVGQLNKSKDECHI